MEQKEFLESEFKKASDKFWKKIERKLDELEYQIEEQPRFLAVEKGKSPWKMETPSKTDYNPTHSKWSKDLNVLMPVEKKETYKQGRFEISFVEDGIEKKSKLDLEPIRIEMQPKMVEIFTQTRFKYRPTRLKCIKNLNTLMMIEEGIERLSKLDLDGNGIEMQPIMVETEIQTGFKYQPTHSKFVGNLNLLMQVEDEGTKT